MSVFTLQDCRKELRRLSQSLTKLQALQREEAQEREQQQVVGQEDDTEEIQRSEPVGVPIPLNVSPKDATPSHLSSLLTPSEAELSDGLLVGSFASCSSFDVLDPEDCKDILSSPRSRFASTNSLVSLVEGVATRDGEPAIQRPKSPAEAEEEELNNRYSTFVSRLKRLEAFAIQRSASIDSFLESLISDPYSQCWCWEEVASKVRKLLTTTEFYAQSGLCNLYIKADCFGCDMGRRPVIRSEYECRICSGLMQNPTVLSCYHRFCWQCLELQAGGEKKKVSECPHCRKSVRDYHVSKTLDSFLSKHFIDEYHPDTPADLTLPAPVLTVPVDTSKQKRSGSARSRRMRKRKTSMYTPRSSAESADGLGLQDLLNDPSSLRSPPMRALAPQCAPSPPLEALDPDTPATLTLVGAGSRSPDAKPLKAPSGEGKAVQQQHSRPPVHPKCVGAEQQAHQTEEEEEEEEEGGLAPAGQGLQRINSLERLLEHARPGTFFALDIDDTLVTNKFHPCFLMTDPGLETFQEVMTTDPEVAKLSFSEKNAATRELQSSLRTKKLVEGQLTADVLDALVEKGCWVFGLTARYSETASMTKRVLAGLGLDLSKRAPFPPNSVLRDPSTGAVFSDGVIYTNAVDKGQVLNRFLQNVVFRDVISLTKQGQPVKLPPEIVFVDDRLDNVTSVCEGLPIASKLGVPITGFHFVNPLTLSDLYVAPSAQSSTHAMEAKGEKEDAETVSESNKSTPSADSVVWSREVTMEQIREFLASRTVLDNDQALARLQAGSMPSSVAAGRVASTKDERKREQRCRDMDAELAQFHHPEKHLVMVERVSSASAADSSATSSPASSSPCTSPNTALSTISSSSRRKSSGRRTRWTKAALDMYPQTACPV